MWWWWYAVKHQRLTQQLEFEVVTGWLETQELRRRGVTDSLHCRDCSSPVRPVPPGTIDSHIFKNNSDWRGTNQEHLRQEVWRSLTGKYQCRWWGCYNSPCCGGRWCHSPWHPEILDIMSCWGFKTLDILFPSSNCFTRAKAPILSLNQMSSSFFCSLNQLGQVSLGEVVCDLSIIYFVFNSGKPILFEPNNLRW